MTFTHSKQLLITSGCSFSHAPDLFTWPNHVRDRLDIPLLEYSMGSQGNALIARNIEYSVRQALLSHSAQDLLVIVMWSGSDRMDCRPDSTQYKHVRTRDMVENPTGWLASRKPWVILNQHFEDKLSRLWYHYFYTPEWGWILTMENILRIQYLLKSLNIDYVMTEYSHNVLPRGTEMRDPELAYLYSAIDWSNWLDCDSEYEWCRDHSGIAFPDPSDDHPGMDQHRAFCDRVIMPHLVEQGWVSQIV